MVLNTVSATALAISRRWVSAALISTACLAVTAPAHAQTVYLVGAYLFSANNTGATVSQGYQYDTNNTDGAAYIMINGAGGPTKSITLALTPGTVNNFTFQTSSTTSLQGPDAALGLFFASTPTSYNPSPSGTARTPDLLVSVAAGGTAFFTPISGTAINNYAYSGGSVANGLSTTTVNGIPLSFTSFTAANGGGSSVAGSFSLSVGGTAAAPEPGTIALLLSGGIPALGFARRRAKK